MLENAKERDPKTVCIAMGAGILVLIGVAVAVLATSHVLPFGNEDKSADASQNTMDTQSIKYYNDEELANKSTYGHHIKDEPLDVKATKYKHNDEEGSTLHHKKQSSSNDKRQYNGETRENVHILPNKLDGSKENDNRWQPRGSYQTE
ncbi:hypothetical protein BDA99DRAFT_553995 [Phascolomyces articulosus]|uniref:Uncharacterized protein n=1 Tax=Phascolomyces articulosus TaxID=60185 RepID=A0AAD5KCB4_9FUNG|nr:hypothetical protein BDA99DRAFT_553995 [Phascolomyces articulosus]